MAPTDQYTRVLGLTEFLNRMPAYAAQLYTIYKYARVTAVDINLELVSTGSVPMQLVIGHVPYEDVAALTVQKLIAKPDTTRKLVAPSGGMNLCKIRKSWNVEQILGSSALIKEHWINAAQAVNNVPVYNEEPVMVIGTDNVSAGAVAYGFDYSYQIVYHLQFFDIEYV